jgi:hypothetical protein
MSTLTKEVVVPDDRHITLDIELPPETPVGAATVRINVDPKNVHTEDEAAATLRAALRPKKITEEFLALAGSLAGSEDFKEPLEDDEMPEGKKISKAMLDLAGIFAESKTFAGNSVALIREIRDEW